MGTVRSCTGVNDALIGFEDLCKSVTGLSLKSPNESSTRLRNPVSCTSLLLPYKQTKISFCKQKVFTHQV